MFVRDVVCSVARSVEKAARQFRQRLEESLELELGFDDQDNIIESHEVDEDLQLSNNERITKEADASHGSIITQVRNGRADKYKAAVFSATTFRNMLKKYTSDSEVAHLVKYIAVTVESMGAFNLDKEGKRIYKAYEKVLGKDRMDNVKLRWLIDQQAS
jgi:hypothetical protein